MTLDIHHGFMVHRTRDGATVLDKKIKGIAGRVFFSQDGSRLYFSAYGNELEPKAEGQLLCGMDTKTWRIVDKKQYLPERIRFSLEKLTESPDGRFLATGRDSVLIWRFPEMERLFELQVPERSKLARVTQALFSTSKAAT